MQRICGIDEIDAEGGRECRIGGPDDPQSLVLLCVGDAVRAYLNVCPHMGRNLSWAQDEFLVTPAGRLVCPHHGASFDIASGECVEGPCRGAFLTPVSVEVRDGDVFLARSLKTSG